MLATRQLMAASTTTYISQRLFELDELCVPIRLVHWTLYVRQVAMAQLPGQGCEDWILGGSGRAVCLLVPIEIRTGTTVVKSAI